MSSREERIRAKFERLAAAQQGPQEEVIQPSQVEAVAPQAQEALGPYNRMAATPVAVDDVPPQGSTDSMALGLDELDNLDDGLSSSLFDSVDTPPLVLAPEDMRTPVQEPAVDVDDAQIATQSDEQSTNDSDVSTEDASTSSKPAKQGFFARRKQKKAEKKAAKEAKEAARKEEALAKKKAIAKERYERRVAEAKKKGKPAPPIPSILKEDLAPQEEEVGEAIDPNDVQEPLPFGYPQSAASFMASQRDNRAKWAPWVKYAVLGVLAIMVVNGAWRTFVPQDVRAIVGSEIVRILNFYGFPRDTGKAYVDMWMKNYLTVGSDKEAIVAEQALRSLSIPVGNNISGAMSNRRFESGVNMRVLDVESKFIQESNEHSATYEVEALVVMGVELEGSVAQDPNGVKRLAFSIDVIFDDKNRTMFIPENSPTLTNVIQIATQDSVAPAVPLGTGEEISNVGSDIQDVIVNYIKGKTQTDLTDKSAISQYLVPNPEPHLTVGFDKQAELVGNPTLEVYKTTDPDSLKVLTTFDLRLVIGAENRGVTFKNVYVTTLRKSGEKWQIEDFRPYKYITAS